MPIVYGGAGIGSTTASRNPASPRYCCRAEALAYDLAAREAPIDVSLLCPGPVLTSISDDLLGIETGDGSGEHLMAGQPGFITAEECASRVFAAIAERQFWIFTHPFKGYLREKMDAIVHAQCPSYSEVVFDTGP